ncbi:restriction endonuclease subunit S [Vibrio vulnificus]|uniref:restriction endonuclease subunit S n=1 Tax=Vibrio vulnificus TaxID=672 RepID=UPI00102A798D|nr:restriction endonuclease subunit S [Vibrio vulnificus]RZP72383.1 restriction endonuclease subunit S [Vibrio vulnificus]RZP74227.1 restriction endonuclease subunit S [Vibrio vulnificus]
MSTTKNVPEIRFEKYKADWVKSDLGELIGVGSAARVHKEQWTKHGVPFYRTSDVVSIYKDQANTQAFISYELYEQLTNKIGKIQRGDLLITGGGSIGIPFLVKNDAPLYFKDADLLWLKNNNKMDGHFLYTFFASRPFRNYLKSISHIGTIGHYTISQAKTTPISYCEREEQGDLGNYFQKLDTLINQHQQKHDKLSNLKKAMQEKMFPKAGETVPEIRFDGFSGDWDSKPLSKVASNISDGDWIEAEHIFPNGKFRIIQTGNIGVGEFLNNEKHAKYFHQRNFDLIKANEIYPGDILISRLAEPAGRAAILPDTGFRMVTAVDVAIVRPEECYDSYFLMSYLNTAECLKVVSEGVSGTSHKRISRANLVKVNIPFPSIDEQIKIGKYFENLDGLINQHNQQITKIKNIKQACLDKMFV